MRYNSKLPFSVKKDIRFSSVFIKFVLSYTILVFLITTVIGVTAYILSKNNYNREIHGLNINVHDQYKRILESQVISSVELVQSELAITVGIDKFFYSSTISPFEIYRLSTDIKKIVTNYNSCISNIHIYDSKKNMVISTLYGLNYLYQYEGRIQSLYPWYYKTDQVHSSRAVWLTPETPIGDPIRETAISVLYPYPCINDVAMHQGYLVVDVRQSYLQKLITGLVTDERQLMIVNDQGYVVAAGHDIPYGISITDLGFTDMGFLYEPRGGGFDLKRGSSAEYITYSEPIYNGWRLIQTTPVTLFYAASYRMGNTIMLICIGAIVLGIVVSYILSSKMYLPIKTLSNMFKRTDVGQKRINEFELMTKQIWQINKQISELNVKMEECMPMIKYNLVMQTLSGTIHSQDELCERLQLINKSFMGNYFNVLLIKLDKRLVDGLEQKNMELLKLDLCQRIENMSTGNTTFIASEVGESELAALIFTIHKDIGILLKNAIDSICGTYGSDITISLGTWQKSSIDFYRSYRGAQNAQKYHFMHPLQIAFFAETLPTGIPDGQPLDSVVDQFEKALSAGNEKECGQHICTFAELVRRADFSYEYCRDNIVRLITVFTAYAEKLNLSNYDVSQIDFSGFSDINGFEVRFTQAITNLFALRCSKTKDKQIELIEALKEYIADNLSGDLSLELLASQIHLSSSYLSRSFKEIVGINLTDYITQLRMERAREMVEQSKIDIQDIAEKVGYLTPHYFSRKFKEFYGYTPKDYRYIMQNNK